MSTIISGQTTSPGRLMIINKSDWTIEINKEITNNFSESVSDGSKIVLIRLPDGEIQVYREVGGIEIPAPTGEVWVSTTHTPLASTLNVTSKNMIDGNKDAVLAPNWNYHGSYGISFDEPKTIQGMEVFCKYTYGDVDEWYGAGYDSVEVYKSNDNANWTLVKHFDAPTISYHAPVRFDFRLVFDYSETAQYFTVWNAESSSYLAVEGGAILRVAEIEVF